MKPGFLCQIRPLCLIVLTMLLGACSQQNDKTRAPSGKAPVPVRLAPADIRSVPVELQTFGTVEARETVPVKARVAGQLLQVHFREGDEVRKGALLFSIDPQPFELAVQEAEAVLARDRAQQQTARSKAERYRQLLEQGFISRQEFDQAAGDAAALDAVVRVDAAALDQARLELGYCQIRAPLAGRTGSLLTHVGSLVKANADEPLVVIHRLQPINVRFTLPEGELAAVRRAMAGRELAVTVLTPGESAAGEIGTLDFIDNAVDAATGTIVLKARFGNADHRLWPGQFVRTGLTLTTLEKVVTVPAAAVQTGQAGPYLYVVTEGSAEFRTVKPGPIWQERTVISDGLDGSEQVVVDGQMRLYPGAKVLAEGGTGKGAQRSGEPVTR